MFKLLSLLLGSIISFQLFAWTPPEQPIRFVIPYSVGGGYDTMVRQLIPHLEEYFKGATIIPFNKEGASGRTAARWMETSVPIDGSTIMIYNIPGHGAGYIENKQEIYDINAVEWVQTLSTDNFVILVAANSPFNTLSDLRGHGTVLVPEQGPGNASYFVNNVVWQSAGIDTKRITGFKGSAPTAKSVLSGETDAMTSGFASALKWVKTGDYRIIAHWSDEPYQGVENGHSIGHPELNNLRSMKVVGLPPGTPKKIVDEWHKALTYALNHPKFVEWAEKTKNELSPSDSPDQASEKIKGVLNSFRG
jgi:tripartite-type tricarboxylate transporter receptor subunit TctC